MEHQMKSRNVKFRKTDQKQCTFVLNSITAQYTVFDLFIYLFFFILFSKLFGISFKLILNIHDFFFILLLYRLLLYTNGGELNEIETNAFLL